MNVIEMMLVGAAVQLQERSTGYFGELESRIGLSWGKVMDLTDRVITMAGLGGEDWAQQREDAEWDAYERREAHEYVEHMNELMGANAGLEWGMP